MTTVRSDLFYRVDCQVRQTRMQLYMRFREPKLYRLAKALEFEKIEDRCLRHPKAAKREAKFRHEYGDQQNALHRVLEPLFLHGHVDADDFDWDQFVQTRHKAAKNILALHPEAARVPCCFGTTSLSMVCLDPHGSLQDVETLLDACPGCLFQADNQGMIPLHYACLINKTNAVLIERLIQHGPQAAATRDTLGRLPLHYAATAPPGFPGDDVAKILQTEALKAESVTDRVMKRLLDAYNDGASVCDCDGLAPLHYMCRHLLENIKCNNENLIRACHGLVKADPSILLVPDKQRNETPMSDLHACCQQLEDAARGAAVQDGQYQESIRILKECMAASDEEDVW